MPLIARLDGSVVTEPNHRVRTDMLATLPVDRKELVGLKIIFSVAFSALVQSAALIAPALEVARERRRGAKPFLTSTFSSGGKYAAGRGRC